MKKFIITALFAFTLMNTSAMADEAFRNNSVKISVNKNEYVPLDTDGSELVPITFNSMTYLPLRSLGEAVGFSFEYESDSKTITISKEKLKTPESSSKTYYAVKTPFEVQPDTKTKIIADGVALDTPVLNINGRTYIPVRAVAEALGLEVEYDAQNSEVLISFDDSLLVQLEEPSKSDTMARLNTSKGSIEIRLFKDYAPKAVENFVTHSKEGYYDGVTFHRVIEDFVIQGGDPEGTGRGGESIWGEPFENETSYNLRNFRGALCMANAGENTNGSQFYIVQSKDIGDEFKEYLANELEDMKSMSDIPQEQMDMAERIVNEYVNNGGCPFLDSGYTVFGQVYSGMDVVDEIASVETDENDKPVEDIIINSIDIYEFE